MRRTRIAWRSSALAVSMLLVVPAAALASGPHLVLAPAFLGPIGQALGSVFHAIGGVVLGAFNWTVGVAAKFILNTLGGLIRLLIPASWAKDGLQVMHWIVAVPDYAGTVTSPSGQSVYGFAGINALRDLFMWVGAALLPLTLVYATSRAAIGSGRHVAAPVGRVLALGAVLLSYPWWWSQAAAAVNQLTHFVLALPPVSHGVYKLMQYAVGGVALGGWQLIDLALMGAIGVALLGLIFLKVVIILLGALLYAIGPLTIALVPTDGGMMIARAWASAATALLLLPLAWATILAVGALLINDSSTAGPLIAGQGTIASLLGGLLLALAGLASLWLCIRAAREAGTILRGQLGGLLVVGRARAGASASSAPAPARRAAESLRSFGTRVAGATGAALGAAGPAGQVLATGAGAIAAHSRRGLLGAGGALIRTGATAVAPGTAALVGRTRAGATAVRMARAGSASWQASSTRRGSPSRASTTAPTGSPDAQPQRASARAHQPDGPSSTASSGRSVHAAPPVSPPAPSGGDSRPAGPGAVRRSTRTGGSPTPHRATGSDAGKAEPPAAKPPTRRPPRRPRPRKGS
jgi:hypothetical protein